MIRGLTCLVILIGLTCQTHGSAVNEPSNQQEWLADDEWLESDELEFDIPLINKEIPWWQGIKTTLQHDVTKASSIDNINRSKLQVLYESSITHGFYLLAQGSYRYFNHQDSLAKNRGETYGKSKLQKFWLQYSTQQCAYTLGRQTLVWGEVDGTFVVDVLTPFDLTEQLFTDYGDLRKADEMLVMDCFYGHQQGQLFYTPKASIHTFSHQQLHVDTGQEWGGRFKYSLANLDLSIMMAHLYGNTPFLNSINFQLKTQSYRLAALGISKAQGRLLMKMDLAHKTNQRDPVNLQRSDTVSMAMGFEYTAADNQNFNMGIWQQGATGDVNALDVPLQLTLGWSRRLLHDDLSLSLMANVSQQPKFENITWLATYKLNDIVSLSSALSLAHISEKNAASSLPLASEALSFSVKVEL